MELIKKYKNNLHSQYLTAHNYQHCLKVLERNWNGFFEAIKEWKVNPIRQKGFGILSWYT